MNKLAAAYVNANVGDAVAVRREEHEVASLKAVLGNGVTVVLILLGCGSGELVTELLVSVINETGTVKTLFVVSVKWRI